MNRREVFSILEDAKALALRYYLATGKPLGITGELAEFMAAQALGLTLCDARTEGFDAFGKDGEKIQIKGRRIGPGGRWGRVPSINTEKEFTSVHLVLMDTQYELFEIWDANKQDITEFLNKPRSKARNERRSMAVSQFKMIGERVYP